MPSLVDMLLAKSGQTRAQLAQKRGAKGSMFRRAGVSDSSELRRILDLPRRDWEQGLGGRFGTTEELVRLVTEQFKTPKGTQEAWPVQAVALAELHDFGGLVGPIRTSGGKTLISFLAGAALDLSPVLLLVPAMMLEVTKEKYLILSEHWNLPEIVFQSYNFLSREENKDWLHNLKPRVIIADEAHKLKNLKAACTKRVHWYMVDFPDTVFVPLSGTPFNRSLQEVGHLVQWALPKFCPIPRDYGTALEWSLCLDEEKSGINALAPGQLIRLCNSQELELLKKEPLKAVRQAFQRRFTETPGVVSVSDPGITIPLEIRGFDLDIDCDDVDFAFNEVRRYWRTPDGRPFAEAVKVWMHCRQIACGFYYIWEPAPPKGWLRARTAWCQDLRHILSHNNRRLATEFQVVKAIQAGLYEVASYWEWKEVRETYKYKKVAVWVHDKTVNFANNWLQNNPEGICWVEHEAFAERLTEVSGLSYFGPGGVDSNGTMIEKSNGPVIASVRANGTGRDLQHNWNRNLVISCSPNGEVWEQMLARTHRFGQKAPKVTVDVLMACSEQYYGFQQAIRDAEFAATMLKQPRKLLMADIEVEALEDVVTKRSPRWQKMMKVGS
jgi:hypothetical protein